MSDVEYRLTNSGLCDVMVPNVGVPAQYPAGINGQAAGLYIIYNQQTLTRYVGNSHNIQQRFQQRLAAVGELGLSVAVMAQIAVFWGQAWIRNTPIQGGQQPQFVQVQNYGQQCIGVLDGVNVNLENLLVRFILTQAWQGEFVSNNHFGQAPYVNQTPNPVNVTLQWGGAAVNWQNQQLTHIWQQGAAW